MAQKLQFSQFLSPENCTPTIFPWYFGLITQVSMDNPLFQFITL